MKTTYKLNGKIIAKCDIPKNANKVKKVKEVHYETMDYSNKESKNAMNFFSNMNDDREELEKRHG